MPVPSLGLQSIRKPVVIMAVAGIGSTLTAGIQDISALLPLLGTEQCEENVGSALSYGYLYAAVSPLSVFGSLGIARAGFKTLLASISISRWRFIGAEKLRDAGFRPSGANLSLIMMDPDNREHHLAETRIDVLLRELQLETLRLDDLRRLKVATTCVKWNLKMLLSTAMLCVLGVTPYIHLNLDGNHLPPSTRWAFPILRVLGGFLATTSLQFLVQRRLNTILKKRLVFHAFHTPETTHVVESLRNAGQSIQWDLQKSSELCLWSLERVLHPTENMYGRLGHVLSTYVRQVFGACEGQSTPCTERTIESGKQEPEADTNGPQRLRKDLDAAGKLLFPVFEIVGILRILMSLGIIAAVVGYIGCFSVVQGAGHPRGPIIWLTLEGILSVIRMIVWGLNPDTHDLDSIKMSLELVRHPPFSTCNKTSDEIFDEKILPLVRAGDFLRSIKSYTGFLKHFDDPDTSIFYTLTRKSVIAPEIKERNLFITMVDHKERATRVYYEDGSSKGQILAASPLTTDLAYDSLNTKIVGTINPTNVPIMNNPGQWAALRSHYQCISVQLKLRDSDSRTLRDEIHIDWKLSTAHTTRQADPEAGGSGNLEPDDDIEYLVQGDFQRKRRRRSTSQRQWIESLMAEVDRQIKHHVDGAHLKWQLMHLGTGMRVSALMQERFHMESLFLHEIRTCEERLCIGYSGLLQNISKKRRDWDAEDLSSRLKKDWMRDTRVRLMKDRDNAFARMNIQRKVLAAALSFQDSREQKGFLGYWKGLQQLLEEEWRLLIQRCTNEDIFNDSIPTISSPQESATDAQKLSSKLKVALDQFSSQEDFFFSGPLYLRCKRARRLRLEVEAEEVEESIDRGLATLDAHLAGFPGCPYSPHIAVSELKWFSVTQESVKDGRIHALSHALRRNRHICLVEFSDFRDDELLSAAIGMTHSMSSLTTICMSNCKVVGGGRTLSAFEDAVTKNTGIQSFDNANPCFDSIKAYIASNPDRKHTSPISITFRGFAPRTGADQRQFLSALKHGNASSIELRFLGPRHGRLELILLHRSSQDTRQIPPRTLLTVKINEKVCPPRVVKTTAGNETIWLSPDEDFQPRAVNLVTITPTDNYYELYDINLYDEDGGVYDQMANVAAEARRNLALMVNLPYRGIAMLD